MDLGFDEFTHAASDHGSSGAGVGVGMGVEAGMGGMGGMGGGGARMRVAATSTTTANATATAVPAPATFTSIGLPGMDGKVSGFSGSNGSNLGNLSGSSPSLIGEARAFAATTAAPTNRYFASSMSSPGMSGSGFLGAAPAQARAPPAHLPVHLPVHAPVHSPVHSPVVPTPSHASTSTFASQASSRVSHTSHASLSSSSLLTPRDPNRLSALASPPAHQSVFHAHRQNHNSSKLPAYRFADLHKDSIAQPTLLQQSQSQSQSQLQSQHQHPPQSQLQSPKPKPQHHLYQHHRSQSHIPRSPVSPNLDWQPETQPTTANPFTPPKVAFKLEPAQTRNHKRKIVSTTSSFENLGPPKSRLSTFQLVPASISATKTTHLKRSISLDTTSDVSNTAGVDSGSNETFSPGLQRRANLSATTQSEQDPNPAGGGSLAEATTKENPPVQRELSLLKTWQKTLLEDKRAALAKRSPVTSRPRTNTAGSRNPASIPPIRSFRSSGDRRSIALDMNLASTRGYDAGDDYGDANHRDRTLRTLEGARLDGTSHARERPDGDDGGDLFLKIAGEDSQRVVNNGRTYADNPNVITRVARSARRPLSVAVSSYRSPSPPRLSRRMSEQQESRLRAANQDQGERTGPPVSFRGHSREPQSEDLKFKGVTTPFRASPLSPRTSAYQDPSDSPSAHRRRQHSVDRTPTALPRMSSIKQTNVNYSHPRAYNSSPLVSHSSDIQKTDPSNEPTPVEGTDSTTSTAAPSTVWDELEELKSRIHRLELTGKLPTTSGATISSSGEDRPPTAHTNATTLSSSPKRGSSTVLPSVEAPIVPKDSHPLLHSALAKSKDFLIPEVYDALETATADALALAAMMGTAGQPGPISSGSSNIGSNSGTVTDRQLRKKADSVCRSLTELCLALSENAGAVKPQRGVSPMEDATMTSPTITHFGGGAATGRRPSVPANRAVDVIASPRAVSRYEEKRATVLQNSALPHSRHNANSSATADSTPPIATAGRKSSLLFARNRRAGTEEPEDGRKTSNMLRSRRGGTEEPEEPADHKPILSRGRRATVDNGEDDSRFRTPSRAITEVNGARPREYMSRLPPPPMTRDVDTLANSALPRRRLNSTINTRVTQAPIVTTGVATPSRRYFDRSTPNRETEPELDGEAEDRAAQRQFALGRSGSMNRRPTHRQTMIVTPSTATTSYYR